MNKIIKKKNQYNTIGLILANYPEAFEGFTEIIEAREKFLNKKNRIALLMSNLNKPYTEVFGTKADTRNQLREALKLAIGTGITVAVRQKNVPLLNSLKRYKSALNRTTINDLPEMANRVHADLVENETVALAAGLTTEKISALQDLTSGFREIVETTDYEISSRKTARVELKTLVSECLLILRDEIDPFVCHCKESYPDFYNAYMTMRQPKKRSRKKASELAVVTDISGVVINKESGLPVADATIIISGIDESFTTDADGYYLIEQIDSQSFDINCFAAGFEVPEPVKGKLAPGESLLINFNLVPVKKEE